MAQAQVINLGAVRAAREAAEEAKAVAKRATALGIKPATPQCWKTSKKGNFWCLDPRTRIHLVVYETSQGWGGRVTAPDGASWYLEGVPPGISNAVEARAWAENWLDYTDRTIKANHLDATPQANPQADPQAG